MVALLDYFDFLKRRHHDHDWVDNLNSRIICIFALGVGFLLFVSEYGARSIECYEKAVWKETWIEYANDLCFIEGSYFVNPNENLPPYSQQPQSKKVSLYQWTPFIYILIALMFHLPRIFWSAVNSSSHMYYKELTESSLKPRAGKYKDYAQRYEQVSMVTRSSELAYSCIEKLRRYLCVRYLILTYVVLKIWNVANVIGAHLLLCFLIADNSQDRFGFTAFSNLIWYRVGWKNSGDFPRLTTCELPIRQYDLGKFDRIKREQVQCYLSANNYIEKLFVVTWIIFAALFLINVCNLFLWIWKIWHSDRCVTEMVRARVEEKKEKFEERLSVFTKMLLPDAKFTFLMIKAQTQGLVSGTFIAEAFNGYVESLSKPAGLDKS